MPRGVADFIVIIFLLRRGELVAYDYFGDFVTETPPRGLGATTDLVHRLVEDNPKAVDLLTEALRRKHGGLSETIFR